MKSRLSLLFLLLFSVSINIVAQEKDDKCGDIHYKSAFSRFFSNLSELDTNYIEPQHYKFTIMANGTGMYDLYRLHFNEDSPISSLHLSSDLKLKAGPYFGYRWAFFGYNFDLFYDGLTTGEKPAHRWELSIYSPSLFFDLFYRKTGSDYKIRSARLANGDYIDEVIGKPFDAISLGQKGIMGYYVVNHKRFSLPAAFSQSTCQKISSGSLIAGFGYSTDHLDIDYGKIRSMFSRYYPSFSDNQLDSIKSYKHIKYHSLSFSGGYAYNWVFAKNWLFSSCLTGALAYKKVEGDTHDNLFKGFKVRNINLDGSLRLGLVYNTMRWYWGAIFIAHSNNFRKSQFSSYNMFGSFNMYVGYNFGAFKKWRKKK